MTLFDMNSPNQGIVHVIGPELGITQPGQTVVCGDSHTSTHGAFGALAFGIGTSEVEHVLATQCLVQSKSKTMQIVVDGKRPPGVTAKDIILAIIGKIGIGGGNGHVIEYGGEAIRALSHGRPHDGLQHVDRRRRARRNDCAGRYDVRLHGRAAVCPARQRVSGSRRRVEEALSPTPALNSIRQSTLNAPTLPRKSLGARTRAWFPTSPDRVPDPGSFTDSVDRQAAMRALEYMGLKPGMLIADIPLDRIFIGSCTNSRIEDLRPAAQWSRASTCPRP